MRLEKGVRVYDECFVGLVRIFILILRVREPTKGLQQRTSLISHLHFKKRKLHLR